MRLTRSLSLAICVALLTTPFSGMAAQPRSHTARRDPQAYKDASLPVDQRVASLLARMTLAEKVAQVRGIWPPLEKDTDQKWTDLTTPSPQEIEAMKDGIGHVSNPRGKRTPRESALYANAIQAYLVKQTRLGIPAIIHDEVLHGHMKAGSTVFPQPIAMASSWDPGLVREIFSTAAREARARGFHHMLGPNMDLAREPRWGRTEETYGEDPYLVARMVVAVVRGLQGEGNIIDGSHVIATGKHFAGHGQPEGGTNIAPLNIGERQLRETHLRTFQAAVKEANLRSIMAAYHEIDGIPSHANPFLLQKVLRQEWGFRGVVVSDYFGVSDLAKRHHIVNNCAEAAVVAIQAGVDIELPDGECYRTLADSVRSNRLPEKVLDIAAGRVLRTKFILGLFENPYVDPDTAERVVHTAEARQLALRAAHEAITLLKNDHSLLPLDRSKLKQVAVIGPNANRAHYGGYTDADAVAGVSVLDGIRKKLEGFANVAYAEGCKITRQGGVWWADRADLSDPADDQRLITEATLVARNSDAVVLVLGGNEDTNKEGWAENHLGDRDSIELVGRQNDLVKSILATGKPTIVFLVNSGPLAISYIAENVPAVVEGFYLGEQGGTAAADVLFGDYNPSGKLPVTFPRSTGQLPAYYNHKPSAERGYLFTSKEPVFPFGHGLSYTTFSYANLKLSPDAVPNGQPVTVTVDVSNTGSRAGTEVAELYIRDRVSSVTRPVMELKDFARVTLQPGETRSVTFSVTPEKLGFYNAAMKFVVEPGIFDIMVGPSSAHVQTVSLRVTP